MREIIKYSPGHIMCDHCPWKSDEMPLELHKEWIDKPCPECGEIVLFESDFLNNQKLCEYAERVNNMSDEELENMFPGIDLQNPQQYKKFDFLLINGHIEYGAIRWNDLKAGDSLFVLQFAPFVGFANFYESTIISIEFLDDGNVFECEYVNTDCDNECEAVPPLDYFHFAAPKKELFERKPANFEFDGMDMYVYINKTQALKQAELEFKEMQLNVEKIRNNIKNISDEN